MLAHRETTHSRCQANKEMWGFTCPRHQRHKLMNKPLSEKLIRFYVRVKFVRSYYNLKYFYFYNLESSEHGHSIIFKIEN